MRGIADLWLGRGRVSEIGVGTGIWVGRQGELRTF